jgi:3-hydroxyisobutyrate dehydrogenase-like beta-hydroxyacid dehydrogenase
MSGTTAVGFIGLGAMGGAMAERLIESGVALSIADANPGTVAEFEARGATRCTTPAAVADAADIVFCCLPSATVSAKVITGGEGVIAGRRAKVVVEMSTIGKQAIEPIAAAVTQAGMMLVDAPVSGGPRGARGGTLSAIVAGDAAALAAAKPYLDIMAKKVFVVGDRPGLAQVMKLVNNLISAANMASAFEAMVFGAKAGLDPDLMVEVVNASTGRNSATSEKMPRSVLTGTFDYGARLDIMYKDITLGLAEAEAVGVPTWTLGAVSQLWRYGMTQGGGAEDYTALIKHIERWAGVEVRSRRDGK